MNYDFVPKYCPPPSCKSNNMTKRHHMWLSDLLHFTLYYMLFVPQTSNLFLNIGYGSVKMCYIMWLQCHRNITHTSVKHILTFFWTLHSFWPCNYLISAMLLVSERCQVHNICTSTTTRLKASQVSTSEPRQPVNVYRVFLITSIQTTIILQYY